MKLKQFQPQLVTDTFNKLYQKVPKSINSGLCMQWAYTAYCMFEDIELWCIGAHAFVKYKGKFYDSERLHGEEFWEDLPACNWGYGCGCNFCTQGARHLKEDKFKKFWDSNFIKPDWLRYRLIASEALEKHGLARRHS